MPHRRSNVLLPLAMPDTKSLRRAVANIIRDIQREHEQTDQQTADQLGVSVGTIRNARNETSDLGALTIARIGAVYGEEAIAPYRALYAAGRHGVAASDPAPLAELADAMSALTKAGTPKARMDALPALKEAQEALSSYIMGLERWRLAA